MPNFYVILREKCVRGFMYFVYYTLHMYIRVLILIRTRVRSLEPPHRSDVKMLPKNVFVSIMLLNTDAAFGPFCSPSKPWNTVRKTLNK